MKPIDEQPLCIDCKHIIHLVTTNEADNKPALCGFYSAFGTNVVYGGKVVIHRVTCYEARAALSKCYRGVHFKPKETTT